MKRKWIAQRQPRRRMAMILVATVTMIIYYHRMHPPLFQRRVLYPYAKFSHRSI